MIKIYSILKKILPGFFYIYLQNKKRLFGLPKSIRKIVNSLIEEDVCLDCGANVGVYSQLFAKYGSKVYSFEPDPVPFKKLIEKSNRFDNIFPIMAAVGTSNSQTKLYLDENYNSDELFFSEHNSLVREKDNVGSSFIEVKMIDIAIWLADFDKIKFMKIDIEGYEVRLINYLIDSDVINKIEYVFVETHEKRIQGLDNQIKELKKKIKNLGIESKFHWDWP